MCGIVGFLQGRPARQVTADTVRAMAQATAHRGPDGLGVWTDAAAGIALGHNRLAIIDLTAAGDQPMASADGRWILSFNGEIYNFGAVRDRLAADGHAVAWRGSSDTEVLLEAIAAWGVRATLATLNGMFAIAVWDRRERRLWLARDRMGEKPLYYGWQGDTFLFGSELKALAVHPAFAREIDRDAVELYLEFGYVPAPYSIYAGISKLPPGSLIEITAAAAASAPEAYWRLPPPCPGPPVAVADVAALLGDAVGLRLRADVPMGAFLSGGIDSSLIVALMQQQAARQVRTFSIGFNDVGFDESGHAAAVAAHLGTDHASLTVTSHDALQIIPALPDVYDEPFADSSQLPTCLLAALTREHVTVALSGDGGDEIFGGYTRYLVYDEVWGRLRRVPLPVRRAAAAMTAVLGASVWQVARGIAPAPVARLVSPGRIQRLTNTLTAKSGHDFYERLVTVGGRSGRTLPRPIFVDQHDIEHDFAAPALGMAFVDAGSYLPDDILVKVDRATMAVGLEGRIPFLDHRVVELAARLPLAAKMGGGVGKRILRDILDTHVPRALLDRPKQGFAVPLGAWLSGPLRDWCSDLLSERSGVVAPFVDWAAVDRDWAEHRTGRHDRSARLWTVLMLLAWGRRWTAP